MMKTLVLVAHPNLEKSRVNRRLVDELRASFTEEEVCVQDLYAKYPDWKIDVEREQRLVSEYDRIVFQFPFYWYSSPALLREWQDLVLDEGWAYGPGGTNMVGKELLVAVTVGSTSESYGPDAPVGYSVKQLLGPFQATCSFIGTSYLEPFILTGVSMSYSDEQLARDAKFYVHRIRSDASQNTWADPIVQDSSDEANLA